jgi:hypothetical protein
MPQCDITLRLAFPAHSAFMSLSNRRRQPAGHPMLTMIITIERKPKTLRLQGKSINVEELSIRLPFARKPESLREMCASGQERVYVAETVEMTAAEYDAFAASFYESRAWLKGKGGCVDNGHVCIEVHAPGRPYLYVDPSGGEYARYVARLG